MRRFIGITVCACVTAVDKRICDSIAALEKCAGRVFFCFFVKKIILNNEKCTYPRKHGVRFAALHYNYIRRRRRLVNARGRVRFYGKGINKIK